MSFCFKTVINVLGPVYFLLSTPIQIFPGCSETSRQSCLLLCQIIFLLFLILFILYLPHNSSLSPFLSFESKNTLAEMGMTKLLARLDTPV